MKFDVRVKFLVMLEQANVENLSFAKVLISCTVFMHMHVHPRTFTEHGHPVAA